MSETLRILGIETSGRRGSVALVEGGSVVDVAAHDEPNLHAERLLALIEELLGRAGLQRKDLSRIGVGVGPGSFTGLRVGIALAQGIAMGLSIPALGIPSLAAMARAVPPSCAGLRCALLDARREEVFAAAYEVDGRQKLAPGVLPRKSAIQELRRRLGQGPTLFIGEVAAELVAEDELYRSLEADLPHAACVALLAGELEPASAPLTPLYIRGPNAVLPKLPPSPLLEPALDRPSIESARTR